MATEEDLIDGYEEFLEDRGALAPLSDSDTTTLFRDLETELEGMIQRYHVPPGDMEKLFQVCCVCVCVCVCVWECVCVCTVLQHHELTRRASWGHKLSPLARAIHT